MLFSAAGYFMHPFGGEPKYESVSALPRRQRATPTTPILVWGSVPEIYWASGLKPATRFITTTRSSRATTPGGPQTSVPAADTDQQMWAYFYEDFTAHPPRYFLDTSPAKVRGAEYSPMSNFPRVRALVRARLPLVRTIDGIDVYERVTTKGQGVDR